MLSELLPSQLNEINQTIDSLIQKLSTIKQQLMQEVENKAATLQQTLDEEKKVLKKEQEKMEQLKSKVKKVSPVIKNIVKLNVGGKKFSTTRETLLSEPSFFTGLLSEMMGVDLDEDGCIFIDRDPKHFPLILNYLRDHEIDLEDLNEKEKKMFMKEVQFYEIRSLMLNIDTPSSSSTSAAPSPFQFMPDFVTDRITLSNNNTTLQAADGDSWNCAMLCNKIVKKWKVRVESVQGNGGLFIGVATKDKFRKTGRNYTKNGYFLNASGYLYGMDGTSGKPYTTQIPINGCSVVCIYEQGQLSFEIDGKNCGIAFSNLPDHLYPAFDFLRGTKLSIEEMV